MGIMSKKGIMFTIISVLVCALMITSFFMYQNVPLDQDVDNAKLRIKSIDRYVSETDVYVRSVTGIASTKTLNFMINSMIGNNSFLNNFNAQFESCLMNGTMMMPGFGRVNCTNESMVSSRFDFLENFSSTKLNINSNITLNNIRITQDNPWFLKVEINYTLVVDDYPYAKWNETRIVYSTVHIAGFKDPTYYIMSPTSDIYSVRYPMIINYTENRYWREFPSTAQQVVANKQYFFWAGAPSYLNRLNNVTEPSICCGIVSIVSPDFINVNALAPGINRSYLDFEFWKRTSVDYYWYRQYDFWESVGPAYRTSANISIPGLNGTIVRNEIASMFNMTNTSYLKFV